MQKILAPIEIGASTDGGDRFWPEKSRRASSTSDHIQNVLDLVIDVIQDDLDLIVMFRG